MSSAATLEFWHTRGRFPALLVPSKNVILSAVYVPALCWAMLFRTAVVSLWLKEGFPHWCWGNQRWEFGFLLPRDYLNCSKRDVFNCRISFPCSMGPLKHFFLQEPALLPTLTLSQDTKQRCTVWPDTSLQCERGFEHCAQPSNRISSSDNFFPFYPSERAPGSRFVHAHTWGILKIWATLQHSQLSFPLWTQMWMMLLSALALGILHFREDPESRICLHLPICSLRIAGN